MTLEQLRIFIAVAELEHVTDASKRLNLTQSATSSAVAALEERHDVKLFDRVGRRIALTEAGRLFLGEARAVLARAEEAALMLDDLTGLRRGRLALAASQTVANYFLPPLMHRFRQRHPGITLTLAIANTRRVCADVEESAVDLGFVEDAVEGAELQVERVAADRLHLVVGAEHPLASRRAVIPADLAGAAFVMREAGSGTRAILEAALAGWGVAPGVVTLELPSNEAVRAAVEAGAGISLLSSLVVAAQIRAGTLVALPIALPERGFHAVRHARRHQSRAAAAFLAVVAEGN